MERLKYANDLRASGLITPADASTILHRGPSAREVASAYLRGLLSRCRGIGMTFDQGACGRYFDDAWRSAEPRRYGIDSTINWYLDHLLSVENVVSRLHGAHILDLGCGAGGLPAWLLRHDIGHRHYTGIDRDPTAVLLSARAAARDATTFQSDLEMSPRHPILAVDVVFAIHLLPFVRQPRAVLSWLTDLPSTRSAVFVLIEPRPSLFWESYFGGTKIFLRRSKDVLELCAHFGWRPIGHRKITCFPHVRLPIADIHVLLRATK